MTVELLVGKAGRRWAPVAAVGQADVFGQAAAPGAAGPPRDRAGAAPEVPPEARACTAAVQVALAGPEAPVAVNMAGKAAVPAAMQASEAPVPEPQGRSEAGSRPWGPWAVRRPGTARSGCCPEGSVRCSIADMGPSEGAVAPAEGTAADIGEAPQVAPAGRAADMVVDRAAGIAAVGRKREALAAAAAGPQASAPAE